MKENIRENIIALNSKINESRSKGKYCDVTINVGEKSFKCHRLVLGSASEYFDAMFEGNFRESKSEEIELKEIEAATFEEVIQFIYTGDVLVTDSNVFNLICASEFYNLPNLKAVCSQFIKDKIKQGALIENAIEIFRHSYGTHLNDKDKLVVLLSAYIRRHLYYFLKTPGFLNIQLDELKIILKRSAPSKNENKVVHAIIQWADQSNHSKYVKDEILDTLLEEINYKNVSPEYMKLIVKQRVRERMISRENENDESKEGGDKSDDVLTAESSSINIPSMPQLLHVYVKIPQKETNVFTLQKHAGNFDWMFLCEANDDLDVMRTVLLDNHLYCLNYTKGVQTFSVSSSISLFDKSYLRAPPLVVKGYDMCGMNNHLFMYNKDVLSNVVRSVEDSEFTDEEVISRGVYMYNCKTDRWMSLPPLLEKLANACMTCDYEKGLVYLIGGSKTRSNLERYVQAYDPRSAAWMAIPPTQFCYLNGACCFSDHLHRPIVSGGLNNRVPQRDLEFYDSVAGKWSTLTGKMMRAENCHRLISQGEKLWAFGKTVSESSVEVYSSSTGRWSEIPSLDVAVEKSRPGNDEEIWSSFSTLADCVTFKPYGL